MKYDLPLSGIRVIDMTSLGMGPMAGQTLGDYGADVIKVEPPEGDIFRDVYPQINSKMSHAFIQFNRNKRSLSLDLKNIDGKNILSRLIKTSDVILSNLRPSAMRKLGFNYEEVKKINPNIIFCAAYGYSELGPYAGRPAADDTIQAMSGVPALQKMATGSYSFVASVVADKAVGQAMVSAIMAAIIHKLRTGKGQAIEVPMFETMVSFVMPEHMAGNTFIPPQGGSGYSRIINSSRRPYPTKDGYICAMPYTTAQWLRFFKIIERNDLAEDPRMADPLYRSKNFENLYALLEESMLKKTTQEWVDIFLNNDILFGRVNSPDDLMNDPHLKKMNMFPVVKHPSEGDIKILGFPIQFTETPNKLRYMPPSLGANSIEICRELKYNDKEIEDFLNKKVIFS